MICRTRASFSKLQPLSFIFAIRFLIADSFSIGHTPLAAMNTSSPPSPSPSSDRTLVDPPPALFMSPSRSFFDPPRLEFCSMLCCAASFAAFSDSKMPKLCIFFFFSSPHVFPGAPTCFKSVVSSFSACSHFWRSSINATTAGRSLARGAMCCMIVHSSTKSKDLYPRLSLCASMSIPTMMFPLPPKKSVTQRTNWGNSCPRRSRIFKLAKSFVIATILS
mmetsp:Transcript_549/g.1134  ORF Transcript_549/g.1134 Transcript_549/m.1134 type:complete len:220 (-) Transcript_549:1678-2337(-)